MTLFANSQCSLPFRHSDYIDVGFATFSECRFVNELLLPPTNMANGHVANLIHQQISIYILQQTYENKSGRCHMNINFRTLTLISYLIVHVLSLFMEA